MITVLEYRPPSHRRRKHKARPQGFLDPDLVPTPLLPGPAPQLESAPAIDLGRARPLFVFRTLAGLGWRLMTRAKTSTPKERGRMIREALEALGGVFVKAGQLMALRQDLFPSELCLELGALHDRARAFSSAEARAIIEEEYGVPLESVFSEFEAEPVAAASIGQCHIATLRDSGERVAVKVQRPDATSIFERDFRILRLYLTPFKLMRRFAYMNWDDAQWELQDMFYEELDYRYEAEALREFRQRLKRHRKIYVPKVIKRWCTRRILVLEYVSGVFMTEYLAADVRDPGRLRKWQRENGVSTKVVGRRLLQSLYRQLFEDHVFHGDLHPGNIILLRDGWVCLIDFGSVGRLDVDFLESFAAYMTAITNEDFKTAVHRMLGTFESVPHTDLDEMHAEFLQAFRAWHAKTLIRELPAREKSMQALTDELQPAMKKYQLSANWSFLRMNRAFATLDITIQKLLPNLDYPREMRRYLSRAGRRAERDKRRPHRTLKRTAMAGWVQCATTVPAKVGSAMSDASTMMERSAMRYKADSSKMSFLMSTLFLGVVRLALVLALIVLTAAFVHQTFDIIPDLLANEHRIDDVIFLIPELRWWEWGLILLVWQWLFVTASRVGRRFSEKEGRADTKPTAV